MDTDYTGRDFHNYQIIAVYMIQMLKKDQWKHKFLEVIMITSTYYLGIIFDS